MTHLTNKRYAADLSNFTNTDPQGRVMACHTSAPRQMFLSLDAKF